MIAGDPATPGSVPAAAPGPVALWYGLLGAPAAWSLHLVVGYALVAVPCGAAGGALGPDPVVGPPVAAIVVSALALLASAGALWTAVGNYRAAPAEEGGDTVLERAARERIAFMGYSGIFVSALFTIGVAFATLGLFVLIPCG